MFGLSFVEILILAAIALVVLGPERLTHLARIAGAWYGLLRRQFNTLQAEIEKEVGLLEAKQMLENEVKRAKRMEATIRHDLQQMEAKLHLADLKPALQASHSARIAAARASHQTVYCFIDPDFMYKVRRKAPYIDPPLSTDA